MPSAAWLWLELRYGGFGRFDGWLCYGAAGSFEGRL